MCAGVIAAWGEPCRGVHAVTEMFNGDFLSGEGTIIDWVYRCGSSWVVFKSFLGDNFVVCEVLNIMLVS